MEDLIIISLGKNNKKFQEIKGSIERAQKIYNKVLVIGPTELSEELKANGVLVFDKDNSQKLLSFIEENKLNSIYYLEDIDLSFNLGRLKDFRRDTNLAYLTTIIDGVENDGIILGENCELQPIEFGDLDKNHYFKLSGFYRLRLQSFKAFINKFMMNTDMGHLPTLEEEISFLIQENFLGTFLEKEQSLVPLCPALFLDRDGIIIKDVPYNNNLDLVELMPGIIDFMKFFKEQKFKIIIVTNQSGVARGKISLSELEEVNQKMLDLLGENMVDKLYISTEHPEGSVLKHRKISILRKPQPGLISRAIDDFNIDIMESLMVGDKDSDKIRYLGLRSFIFKGDYPIKSKDSYESLEEIKKAYLLSNRVK